MSNAADKTFVQKLAVNHYLFHVNERKFHKVEGEFIIGRQAGNLILSGDRNISRQHCRFKAKGLGLFISDLGSTNKTYLNGQEVGGDEVYLKLNDQIQVGENIFIYTDSQDPVPLRREGPLANVPFSWKNVLNFKSYTSNQLRDILSYLVVFTIIDAFFIFGTDFFPDLVDFGHTGSDNWPWLVFLSHFSINLVLVAAFISWLYSKTKTSVLLKFILVTLFSGFMVCSWLINLAGGVFLGQKYVYSEAFYSLLEKNIQENKFERVRKLYWNCHIFVLGCSLGKYPKPKKILDMVTNYRENEWKTLLGDKGKWKKMMEDEKKRNINYYRRIDHHLGRHFRLKAPNKQLNDSFYNEIFLLFPGISLHYYSHWEVQSPSLKGQPGKFLKFSGTNFVHGKIRPKSSTDLIKYMGHFEIEEGCMNACEMDKSCKAYTWINTDPGAGNYAGQCFFQNGERKFIPGRFHFSGIKRENGTE